MQDSHHVALGAKVDASVAARLDPRDGPDRVARVQAPHPQADPVVQHRHHMVRPGRPEEPAGGHGLLQDEAGLLDLGHGEVVDEDAVDGAVDNHELLRVGRPCQPYVLREDAAGARGRKVLALGYRRGCIVVHQQGDRRREHDRERVGALNKQDKVGRWREAGKQAPAGRQHGPAAKRRDRLGKLHRACGPFPPNPPIIGNLFLMFILGFSSASLAPRA